jgi:hypothetical protein
MLPLSITATTTSDLPGVGQGGSAPQDADGFLALLNAGINNGILPNTQGLTDPNSNLTSINNTPEPPVKMPTSVFTSSNTQQDVPPPPAPLPPQAPAPSSAANQAANNTNNNSSSNANNNSSSNASQNTDNTSQNTNGSTSSGSSSSASSNSSNQNSQSDQSGSSSSSGQSTGPAAQGQTSGGSVGQANKQLRTQIQNQLGDISQILLGMIQALSVTPAQQLPQATTDTTGTSLLQQVSAAGNSTTDQGAAAGSGSSSDQGVSLLKDMLSLLQQLQQALVQSGNSGNNIQQLLGQDSNSASTQITVGQESILQLLGQGGNSQIQALSNSLLNDLSQLQQLVGLPTGSSSTSTNSSLLSSTQLQALSSLFKGPIAQAQAQLQTLQTSNDTTFAQFSSDIQNVLSGFSPHSKFASDNSNTTNNNTSTNTNNNAPVITPDITVKPTDNGQSLNFTATVAQGPVTQDGSSSSGNGSQDSGQNPLTQQITDQQSPTTNNPGPVGNASFLKLVNQASQGQGPQGGLIDQVQFQVKTALNNGDSKITIQLNPPELGKLDVKLEISADGKASGITITATNQSTLDLLQRDTQGLTRALNDAGLTTDSSNLNFSLGGGQQNQTQSGSQQAATTYQQAQPDEEDPVTAINTISSSYVVNLTEGLDITI